MESFAPTKLSLDQLFTGKVPPAQPISQASLFRDDSWDMSSLIHIRNLSPKLKIIKFNYLLPDGSRLTDASNAMLCMSTKEFFYWRLQGHPPIYPVKPTTVVRDFIYIRILIFWMIDNKYRIYSQLQPHHIEHQFVNSLKGISTDQKGNKKSRPDGEIVQILNLVQRLWDFREVMSDSLIFNPFKGKSPGTVLGIKYIRGEENKTPTIPDEVMIPIGIEALNYVYVYSDDILAARAQVELVRESLAKVITYKSVRGIRGDLIFNVPVVNNPAIAALKEVSISQLPDTGKAWREPFSRLKDLYLEESHLFTACFIVIAWLTGMRYSEITSLCENCLSRELTEDGLIKRLKLKGRLFKGVRDPKGREETWVTIEPVAKAIDVLTRLTDRLRTRTEGMVTELFLRGDRRLTPNILSGDSCSQMLQQFAEHINLPLVDGKVWKLSSRQFRRTLARWIARRPFGELAGMIQFKHLELATFEGYVGRDTNFCKDLAEEKLLSNIDLLEDLKHEAFAGTLAGPKAPELIDMFLGIAGNRRANDEAYMLKHLARTLYVGMFNLCFYDPAYAMCQQHIAVQERKAPIISHCQPDRCSNSCITKRHLSAYQSQLDESKRLLKTPKLSTPQRIALEQEKERMERIIRPLLD